MGRSILAVAIAALMAAGCASAPSRCAVIGERASLAGTWDGEFVSKDSDRSGTIHFELKAGQDSAYGDVLIVPAHWQQGGRVAGQPAPAVKLPDLVRIKFVYVADNLVQGTLDDYPDPACDCTLTTIFDGRIAGNEISGRYESRYRSGTVASTGTWQVRRVSGELHARIDGRDAVR